MRREGGSVCLSVHEAMLNALLATLPLLAQLTVANMFHLSIERFKLLVVLLKGMNRLNGRVSISSTSDKSFNRVFS